MKDNEYKCASCLQINQDGWSDEEREKEMLEIWGNISPEQRVVICDDCFNRRSPEEIKMMGEIYKLNNYTN